MFTTYQLVLPHRHRRSALFSHYVGWSIRWSVRPLVPLYFFGVFKQFEGRQVKPTNRLTDPVTYKALWARLTKNTDSLVHLLVYLHRSLAPDCSLHSRPPLRSLVCSLAHFAHSLVGQ